MLAQRLRAPMTTPPSQPEAQHPYLTADLAGTGGVLRSSPEDFLVEELPAYEPSGSGDHVFVTIEKRGLTTPQAVDAIARALGLRSGDIGWAGMKDRHAVTRQLLSLPPPCSPEAALALQLDGVAIQAAVRHPHKLRTGHLRGNRFVLVVRDTAVAAEVAADRATAILARLARPPGCPNWYGEQRFGVDGENAARGRALLESGGRNRRGDGRQQRFLLSALQSSLFNEFLRRRMADGLFDQVLAGDLLAKRPGGGQFPCTEPAVDQARLEAGELVATGPMYGHSMRAPPPGSPAAAREAALLADEGLTLDSFRPAGRLAEGTRRPLAVDLGSAAARPLELPGQESRAIEVTFQLPAGAYATVVMREIVKGEAAGAPTDPSWT
jgi:tRNA pseudouridine13 synthase